MSETAYGATNTISSSAAFSTVPVSQASPSPIVAAAASQKSRFSASVDSGSQQQQQHRRSDQELESKVKKACERVSENLHICANEPSLAFYRLAEHVRKALPPTVESRQEVRRLHQQLRGAFFDAEYGLETVKKTEQAATPLSNAQELLKNAILLQQQIKYEQQRSQVLRPTSAPSRRQRGKT